MIDCVVSGVGVLGPGLAGWEAARGVLAGEQPYRPDAVAEPRPAALPPNEQRRGARTVRWAIAAAQEALQQSGDAPSEAATVFSSSSGDGETLAQICEALAQAERAVSPTRFHNSVHNAAAGYWSIAAASRRPSTTLCGHDASFTVALLEAAVQVAAGEPAVLLVAYDLPYPPPLFAARPIAEPLAVALLICAARPPRRVANLRVAVATDPAESAAPGPRELASNPAARALPLLAAVARGQEATLHLPL